MTEIEQAQADGFAEMIRVNSHRFRKQGETTTFLASISDAQPEGSEFQVGDRERVSVSIEVANTESGAAALVIGDTIEDVESSETYRIKTEHRSLQRRTTIFTANVI